MATITSNDAGEVHRSYAPLYLSTSLRDIAFDIEELEQYALGRLRLLKDIDSAKTSAALAGPKIGSAVELRRSIRQLERQHQLHVEEKGNIGHDDQLLKDEASHFLLRLALCRQHEHRQWLLGVECALFAARLEGASTDHILNAVRRCGGPPLSAVTRGELEAENGRLRRELDEVTRGVCRQKNGVQGIKFFRVAFDQVPGLVRSRRVLLRDGDAYVPEVSIQDVVVGLFRTNMNQSLTLASKAVALADADRRMRPILESVRQHHVADLNKSSAFDSDNAERISLDQLNESLPAMPLCMQNMIQKLRQHHHLRYSARLQLGVFLKGCGLTMEESLHFWRVEFGKGAIDSSKFEKQYAYNIRHHYGKEGKRQNLKPFPCMKIINDRPGPGEYNGCPYREFQEAELASSIRRLGVDNETTKQITAKAKEGNFQGACGMCFRATQPISPDDEEIKTFVTSHPNEYFLEARRRRIERKAGTQMRMADEDEDMPPVSGGESQSQSNTQDDERARRRAEEEDMMLSAAVAEAEKKHKEKEVESKDEMEEQRPYDSEKATDDNSTTTTNQQSSVTEN